MKGYQIEGFGAPQQQFYYAGRGQPSGVRAPPQTNLARPPGLGQTAPNGIGTLLVVGALLYAFGVFGSGFLGRK